MYIKSETLLTSVICKMNAISETNYNHVIKYEIDNNLTLLYFTSVSSSMKLSRFDLICDGIIAVKHTLIIISCNVTMVAPSHKISWKFTCFLSDAEIFVYIWVIRYIKYSFDDTFLSIAPRTDLLFFRFGDYPFACCSPCLKNTRRV